MPAQKKYASLEEAKVARLLQNRVRRAAHREELNAVERERYAKIHAAQIAKRAAEDLEYATLFAQGQKRCTFCLAIQALHEFRAQKGSRDGLHARCRTCRRLNKHTRYVANIE